MGRKTGPKHLKESDSVSRRSLLITPALGISLALLGGPDAFFGKKSPQLTPENSAEDFDPEYYEVDVPPRMQSHTSRAVPTKRKSLIRPTVRPSRAATIRQNVIGTAKSLYGVPYSWGGTTRRGLDCSGLTQYAYQAAGLKLPRVADDQMHALRIVRNPLPGDLVFFTSGGGYAFHVGLWLARGLMIDAPHHGTTVGNHSIWSNRVQFGRHPALA